jgi:1,4-alpha-glucan branching enzyme
MNQARPPTPGPSQSSDGTARRGGDNGGDLAIVLHAHLPFVRHPENAYHLEENWLYEALTATYLPILQVLREVHAEKRARHGASPTATPLRMTLSLSPPLCAMLRDPLLLARYRAYSERLLRLGEEEIARAADEPTIRKLARFYVERFTALHTLFRDIDGDVLGAFGSLQEAGCLDVITTCATHGYLPVIREPAARRAQIAVAMRAYRGWFGRYPRGLWLPECGYADGVDQLLSEHDLRYFFTDAHGLLYARPRPPLGLHAPIFTPSGVAAFARDLDSSRSVWSATEGYPADPVYRDFYRDIGFDRPLSVIAPYIHPDGIRVSTGYKYHRVTGPRVDLADKALYDPDLARERADEHARDFVQKRRAQLATLAKRMDRRPILVSPYDAELFGHWWFEGPDFLRGVLRRLSGLHQAAEPSTGSAPEPLDGIRLNTATGYLQDYPINAVCEPAPSSWGEGGYSAVWVDGSNDWIYRHVHRAETLLHELASRHAGAGDDLLRRALNQLARELLLAQSSDWAFIMKTGTAVKYATERIKSHLARFQQLARQIVAQGAGAASETGTPAAGGIDADWLAELEHRDNLFPDLDFRLYA